MPGGEQTGDEPFPRHRGAGQMTKEPAWRRWIPASLEPVETGHTVECEDYDGNKCICGKSAELTEFG